MQYSKTLLLLAFAGGLLTSCGKDPDPGGEVYFPKVKAIIENKCNSCHLSTGDWSGRPTKFDTDALISDAYQSIKAAVADPVTPTNKRMPQTGSLTDTEINTIVEWYKKGGKITD